MALPRQAILLLLTAGIAGASGLMGGWPGPHWRLWERAFEDQMVGLLGERPPPKEVVVVAIDDATLQQGSWFGQQKGAPAWARGIGTLPWPRAAYGLLAERLLDAGAAVVGINVTFTGPSQRGSADDGALAASLRRHPGRIALAAEMSEGNDPGGAGVLTLVRPEPFMAVPGMDRAIGLGNTPLRLPGEPLRHPEAYAGGVLRSQGVAAPPSLPLAILGLLGRESRQDDAQSWLNPYGPEGSFRRLSAWEVLDRERWDIHPQRRALAGTIAIVGQTLAQGDDGYPTPFGPLSGPELLATATANSLRGDGLRPWPTRPPARGLLAGLPVVLVGILALSRAGLPFRLFLVGLALAGLFTGGVLLQQRLHLWLPLLAPAAGLALLGVVFSGDAYLLEGRERRRLRHTFERYVAPGVVAEILADPAAAQGILRGRTLDVTVLFCDLKGFTRLTRERSAAGLSEAHVNQLNTYLGAMVDVIMAHGGTVDKFIGDAVMAVFGSPVPRGVETEARAAVACALAMGQALQRLNGTWAQAGIDCLENGVGIASGPAVVGQIGSPKRMEFTVIGDTVNRAARLESLTRQLEARLLLDQATAERLGHPTVALGRQVMKGLGDVEVFTPLGCLQTTNPDSMAQTLAAPPAGSDLSSAFRAAYENRYTWDPGFGGYRGRCVWEQEGRVVEGTFTVGADLKASVEGIEDPEVQKAIASQLWEVAIHRVRRSFEQTHGENTFTAGDTDAVGTEVIVGGKNAGDRYRIKDNVVTMVHRHIHGTVVTIFTTGITETGHGYLSHTYTSRYSDPATGEARGGENRFEDTFLPLNNGGPWVLARRVVEATDAAGGKSQQIFRFEDLSPLLPN